MAACCAARGVVVVEVAGVGCVGSTLRSVSFRLLVAMGSASYLIIPQNRLPDDFYTHQYVNDDTCVAEQIKGYHLTRGASFWLNGVEDGGANQFDGDVVLAALRHDDVGVAFRRLDKGNVHRSDGGKILRDHTLHRPPTVAYIAQQPANEAQVSIGIHKDLDIEEVAQSRLHEEQDALDDQHRTRLNGDGLRRAGVSGEVVDGALNRVAR